MGADIRNICTDVDLCKNNISQPMQLTSIRQSKLYQREQPLKPIEFDDIVVDSRQEDKKQINFKSQQVSTLEKAKHEFNNAHSMRSQLSKVAFIRKEDVTVIMKSEVQDKPNILSQQSVDVPFSVVELIISPDLNRVLHQTSEGRHYFGKFQVGFYEHININDWKLNKNNFYINRLPDSKRYAVINQNYFYEGSLIQQNGKILPHEEGILINVEGTYNGTFKKGKPQGSGRYYNFNDGTQFEGRWANGSLVEGHMKNEVFQFKGKFQDSYAQGLGVMQFRNNMKYTGSFKAGVFSGEQCMLETPDYVYKGGFEGGKKHGKGVLMQHQKATKGRKMKYKPSQQYIGLWQQDRFNRKQLVDQYKNASKISERKNN